MLTSVPEAINRASRLVTLRHPNSFKNCVVYRKQYLRTAAESMGGLPTINGMGVLSGEEEAEYDWEQIGTASLYLASPYIASPFNDRRDNVDYAEPQYDALIECELDPSDPDFFICKKGDVVYWILPSAGSAIAWEVVDLGSGVGITPHTSKYAISKRDDLLYIANFDAVR